MPAWATFPQISGQSVVAEDFELDDPVIENQFENGWLDVRVKRSRARYDNVTVTYFVNAADASAILGFLRQQRLRSAPFYYTHPDLGTMFVRLKASNQKVAYGILGTPVWYTFQLVFEEMF